MKKKIATMAIITALLLGSIQVYAATVLDTNIISLIMDGFASIKSYYTIASSSEMTNLDSKYINDTNQYVDTKTNDIINEIENHKNNETARAEQELESFLQSMKQEVDSIASTQIKDSKDGITEDVNKSINDIKADITKELEKQIKEKLKK